MFKILDGREHFYQWDSDRKLVVEDSTIKEVHFCNRTEECSLVCETFVEDGMTLVNVPNILLQTDWKIRVYAYSGFTKYEQCFEVIKRSKPADYVYTETELWTAEKALEKALEDIIASGELKGDKGDKGDPGVIEFIVVSSLPTTDIKTEAIYLVPVKEITDENYYDEYIYNNFTGWEKIGNIAPAADLEDYLTIDKLNNYLANNPINIAYLGVSSIISAQEVQTKTIYAYDWDSYWTATSSKSLGMLLDTKANEMKLLNKFTFTEDAASVEITQTDDGVNYSDLSLRRFIIFTQTAASSDASTTHMLFKFPNNTNFYTITQSIGAAQISDAAYLSMLEVDLTKSILHQTGGGCKNGYAATMQYHTSLRGWASTIGNVIKGLEDPTASGIKWASHTDGVLIPAGSKIEIWGCA